MIRVVFFKVDRAPEINPKFHSESVSYKTQVQNNMSSRKKNKNRLSLLVKSNSQRICKQSFGSLKVNKRLGLSNQTMEGINFLIKRGKFRGNQNGNVFIKNKIYSLLYKKKWNVTEYLSLGMSFGFPQSFKRALRWQISHSHYYEINSINKLSTPLIM